MEQLPLLIIVGAIAGVLSGMFGIGGGAIIVPALMIFLGFSQVAANGTSLAALLLPVGILAVLEYHRANKLKIWPALAVGLGLASGTWFGAVIALDLPADLLRQAYGSFLIYMAWRYIAPRKWLRELRGGQTEQVAEDTEVNSRSPRVVGIAFAIGVVAGIFSGLFGIGGGVVIVPALMLLLQFDQKLATGTSLGALLGPVGLPGAVAYYQADALDLTTALPLAVMLLIGAIVGARLALGLPTKTVRRLYGFFLLVVGLRFLFNL
jgi:uncharacterized protein